MFGQPMDADREIRTHPASMRRLIEINVACHRARKEVDELIARTDDLVRYVRRPPQRLVAVSR